MLGPQQTLDTCHLFLLLRVTNLGPLMMDLISANRLLHSFNNCLLTAYCVAGLGPDPGDTIVNKTDKIPALTGFCLPVANDI